MYLRIGIMFSNFDLSGVGCILGRGICFKFLGVFVVQQCWRIVVLELVSYDLNLVFNL